MANPRGTATLQPLEELRPTVWKQNQKIATTLPLDCTQFGAFCRTPHSRGTFADRSDRCRSTCCKLFMQRKRPKPPAFLHQNSFLDSANVNPNKKRRQPLAAWMFHDVYWFQNEALLWDLGQFLWHWMWKKRAPLVGYPSCETWTRKSWQINA